MSIAALSNAAFTQDVVAPQRTTQALPPSSVEAQIVDTRTRRTIDRIAALAKDEYDVNSYSNPSINSEETETEGLSVYA